MRDLDAEIKAQLPADNEVAPEPVRTRFRVARAEEDGLFGWALYDGYHAGWRSTGRFATANSAKRDLIAYLKIANRATKLANKSKAMIERMF